MAVAGVVAPRGPAGRADGLAARHADPSPPGAPRWIGRLADPLDVATRLDPRPRIPVGVATNTRVVGLSFDDGPDPRWTPAVLDALRTDGARATFFVTGSAARAHPDLVRRMAAEGHEVANHTDSHSLVEGRQPPAVAAELGATSEAIVAAGVDAAPYFRPPKGRYDEATVRVAADAGLRVVGWTICLERWLGRGAALRVDGVVRRVRPGGILVAHDGGVPDRTATVAAVPLVLGRLRAAGYRVVPVGELLTAGTVVLGRPGESVPGRFPTL